MRLRSAIALFLCAAALLGCLSGCSVGGKEPYVPTGNALYDPDDSSLQETDPVLEQELTLVYYPERSMNPLVCTDYTNQVLLSLMYQGLFAVGPNYQAVPMLCGSYSVNEEMTSYTFYVAENATFSDGSAVTNTDVVASLKAAQDSSLYTNRFVFVYDIYTTGERGITIDLYTAYEDLPILLDVPILKATEVESASPLGSGPYKLSDGQSGARLVRRTDWWCQSEDLDATASAIHLVEAQTNAQIRDSFEFSDVGLVCTDPGSDTYTDYRSDYELWDVDTGIFLYLGFNLDSKVFSNASLRALVIRAIDREALVQDYYRGFAQAATLPAAPHSPYYSTSLARNYAYDPDAVSQAVVSDGKITMLVCDNDSLRLRVARAIKDMLDRAGFTVEIKTCDSSHMNYTLNDKDEDGNRGYDLYLAQTKLSPNMDLSQFFRPWGTLNYGSLNDENLENMCKEALANQGNYYNLHKKIMDESLICPILFRSYAVYGVRGLVSTLEPARDNVFFYTRGQTLRDIQIAPEDSGDYDADGETE